MDEFIMVYMTAANRGEAVRIGRDLVEGRLAACVNVIGDATSIYRWRGQVEEAGEVVFVAKTQRTLFERLAARVRELHSYDTPCIVAYPMSHGTAPYLAWLRDATTED